MAGGISTSTHPLAALRRLAQSGRAGEEHCELCGREVAVEHEHLMEPGTRKLACACLPCALLFEGAGGKFRRVPRHVETLV
ncbi:MAG TPA: DUF5947 family protein, partial [Phycisphaerae bacterium]